MTVVRTIGSGGDCEKLQTLCTALEREPPNSNWLLPGGGAGMLLPDCLKEEEEEEGEGGGDSTEFLN